MQACPASQQLEPQLAWQVVRLLPAVHMQQGAPVGQSDPVLQTCEHEPLRKLS